MKIFIASFSRASNGAISLLKRKMAKKEMLTDSVEEAKYILAVGDRWETFDFVLAQWRNGKKIIHLWAGEGITNTKDDVYRNAMTLMSDLQLCTNEEAKKISDNLCESAGKKQNSVVVGNVMLENLKIDESVLKEADLKPKEYDLILYNPHLENIKEDLKQILDELMMVSGKSSFVWLRPNTDAGQEFILPYANSSSQPRPKFLGLLKNCRRFITNSSSMYYEAPFLIKKNQIIPIGQRNKKRNSKHAKMDIPNASENIINEIQKLAETKNQREETD